MKSSDKKYIESWLWNVYTFIGMDRPSNHDELLEYMVSDIDETADEEFSEGDIVIAYRRFMEEKEPTIVETPLETQTHLVQVIGDDGENVGLYQITCTSEDLDKMTGELEHILHTFEEDEIEEELEKVNIERVFVTEINL